MGALPWNYGLERLLGREVRPFLNAPNFSGWRSVWLVVPRVIIVLIDWLERLPPFLKKVLPPRRRPALFRTGSLQGEQGRVFNIFENGRHFVVAARQTSS